MKTQDAFGLLLCLCLCGCDRSQHTPLTRTIDPPLIDSVSEPVGRYQVVSVSTTSADGTTKHLVLKVDSATGKTWKYMYAAIATGQPRPEYLDTDGWEPLSDEFSASLREVSATAEKFKSGEYKLGK